MIESIIIILICVLLYRLVIRSFDKDKERAAKQRYENAVANYKTPEEQLKSYEKMWTELYEQDRNIERRRFYNEKKAAGFLFRANLTKEQLEELEVMEQIHKENLEKISAQYYLRG